MSKAKYFDEFKAQVVREIVEKRRTIASVAASYDLAPQTVENWVARYRKRHFGEEEGEAAAESTEIDRRAQG